MNTIRVWDLPTRLFHWSLALLILALVITGNIGGNAMAWHFRCGYAVLSLLMFRLVWGFVGGHWSRWRQLTCTPTALRAYFSSLNGPQRSLGHNPLGSMSVIAMMSLLLLQVTTGLFSDDEIANAGPLTVWVSESIVATATHWHKGLGKSLVLLLLATHVGAIVWYWIKKKDNLSRAMVWGDKSSESPAVSSLDRPLDWLKALVCLALGAALVFVLINAVPPKL
jgi:cytochrome b